MARLSDPITILKGIGPARAKQFENLNIFTLEDLICHFPRGYEDRTRLVTIDKLEVDKPACFKAMVMNTPRTAHIRKGLDLTKVQVADHTGRLNLTFFNNKYIKAISGFMLFIIEKIIDIIILVRAATAVKT